MKNIVTLLVLIFLSTSILAMPRKEISDEQWATIGAAAKKAESATQEQIEATRKAAFAGEPAEPTRSPQYTLPEGQKLSSARRLFPK